jgi:hypothetical protein
MKSTNNEALLYAFVSSNMSNYFVRELRAPRIAIIKMESFLVEWRHMKDVGYEDANST